MNNGWMEEGMDGDGMDGDGMEMGWIELLSLVHSEIKISLNTQI